MASLRACPQRHAQPTCPLEGLTCLKSHRKPLTSRHKALTPVKEAGPHRGHILCSSAEKSSETTTAQSEDRTSYRLVQITLKKPMGLILADNKTRTNVIVEEVVSGGNAEKSGKVQVGDIVSSATVLKDGMEGKFEKEGYGQRLYTNWEKIMFDCEGEDFDTVMKALSSNTERWGIFDVTLELKRYISQAGKEAN